MSLPITPDPTAIVKSSRPAVTAHDRGRTLHLIDIENLVAGMVTPENVRRAWQTYLDSVGIRHGDQTRVACSATSAPRVAFSVPMNGLRLLVGGRGPNAADLALIHSVDPAFTARRFDTVVIASADHAFASLAAALGEYDCTVHVAHNSRCASALRLASTAQFRLPCLQKMANNGHGAR